MQNEKFISYMNYKVWLLVTLLFSGLLSHSQNTLEKIDQVVEQIKIELDACRKVEQVRAENAYKCLYYSNALPVAIKVIENGRINKQVTWYFYEQKLLFTETLWMDSSDGKIVHHEKTYHYNESMIAWLDNENTFVEASSQEFIALDKALKIYGRTIYQEALAE